MQCSVRSSENCGAAEEMRYRRFGRLDWKVSALGFGIMRLPVEGDDQSAIRVETASEMVRRAIDGGVNYLDTAYPYHGGRSESFLGEVLKDGYRGKVRIATKLPTWKVKEKDDFDRYFDEQMERLQLDRVDFYLLHSLQRDWWDRVRELGYLDWAERQQADGRISHLGFSFHDRPPLLRRIVDGYDGWTVAMLMYNYMDVDFQAGTEGVGYAADNGLAVAVMEPLRGGLLAQEPPVSVGRIFENSGIRRTPAQWSLRWLWDRPEISTVVSGMSTMEQLEQNLGTADHAAIGTMGAGEKDVLERVRREYLSKRSVPCTDCRYCVPCPREVAIPWIFGCMNTAEMYEALEQARREYSFIDEKNRADSCNGCGECAERCPRQIDIPAELERAGSLLSGL